MLETRRIEKALLEVEENGSFWPGLATDSRTMDVIGKIFLETTSMCLIKTLCFTEWLLKLTHP